MGNGPMQTLPYSATRLMASGPKCVPCGTSTLASVRKVSEGYQAGPRPVTTSTCCGWFPWDQRLGPSSEEALGHLRCAFLTVVSLGEDQCLPGQGQR